MPTAISEMERARFLGLCAAGRYAEAESMLFLLYPDGRGGGDHGLRSRAAFYEDWADAVGAIDPDAARTAYAQADELYTTVAGWASARDEDARHDIDVDRIRHKQRSLAS